MSKNKPTRTLTISDDVFNGLKTLALIQGTSVSGIFEKLGRQYIADNITDLRNYYNQRLNLFEGVKNDAE